MTTLYRFFDIHGNLLYVGISAKFGNRLAAHAREKLWFSFATTVTLEHFATREEAEGAEAVAIQTEHPSQNIVCPSEPWSYVAAGKMPGQMRPRDYMPNEFGVNDGQARTDA